MDSEERQAYYRPSRPKRPLNTRKVPPIAIASVNLSSVFQRAYPIKPAPSIVSNPISIIIQILYRLFGGTSSLFTHIVLLDNAQKYLLEVLTLFFQSLSTLII